jgi:hypothetical protein
MKTFKNFYKAFLILPILFFYSCTDSTTEDGTGIQGEDILFANIQETTFTGIYDTLGYTLLVNNITKDFYEMLNDSSENEDSIRNKVCGDKEGGCMEAMEQYYISKVPDKVKRNGKELILFLTNGSTKVFVNNEAEGDSYEVYQFQSFNNGYYTVAVFYYEEYGYYLINAATGKATFTIGPPILSPDQKQFAAANYDMVAAFTFNGLELLSLTKDSAMSTFKFDFYTWGPEEIKWKDDSTLYVKQKSQPEEGPEENNYAAIRIRRKSGL